MVALGWQPAKQQIGNLRYSHGCCYGSGVAFTEEDDEWPMWGVNPFEWHVWWARNPAVVAMMERDGIRRDVSAAVDMG